MFYTFTYLLPLIQIYTYMYTYILITYVSLLTESFLDFFKERYRKYYGVLVILILFFAELYAINKGSENTGKHNFEK